MHYECASCHNEFVQTSVQVDHILPAVDPLIGFVSWDEFINRLFCPASNLQILCKDCHQVKTKAERLAAKLHKMQKGIVPLRNSQKGKQK
jgi:5-methylcytosine-specific restriction endonuclease McrA